MRIASLAFLALLAITTITSSYRVEAVYCMDFVYLYDEDTRRATSGRSYIEAWAAADGYACIPSDGNLYDTRHHHGIRWAAISVLGIVDINGYYFEGGCYGDWFVSVTHIIADIEGDGRWDLGARAEASIYAGPCGVT